MRRPRGGAASFRQLLTAGAIVVFVLAIAGGGYFLRNNMLTTKKAVTPATASPSSGPSATPTPAPPNASGPLAVLVGPDTTQASGYVVSLVNATGQTVASARAARRTNLTGAPLPEVSTSATRVYYLDGDAVVRSLTRDGQTAAVATLEASPQVHAAFAVSPDDLSIAVSAIDYSKTPPTRHLYVSDLNGGNRSEVAVSGNPYVWPVAWHDGNLVLASGSASATPVPSPDGVHPWCDVSAGLCTADNPYGAVHGFEVVDAKTGKLLATLGSDQCQAIGLLTSAGTLCREFWTSSGLITPTQECKPELTNCLRLAGWSGGFTEWTTLATVWIGALTPSASQMAGCCNVDAINLYEPRAAGGGVTRIHNSASPVAWFDDYNLIYAPFGTTGMQIFSVTSGADIPIAALGVPVAILPAP